MASDDWVEPAERLHDHLGWQSELDPAELAAATGCTREGMRVALAAIATRGLAGYDAATGYYFHRELPFDLSAVHRD